MSVKRNVKRAWLTWGTPQQRVEWTILKIKIWGWVISIAGGIVAAIVIWLSWGVGRPASCTLAESPPAQPGAACGPPSGPAATVAAGWLAVLV
jgi:hypothetical protein